MTLTLQEACARAGLTPRQMRYRIQQGEVKAHKVEGRWVIDEGQVPRDPARERRAHEKAAELKQAVDGVRVFNGLGALRAPRTLPVGKDAASARLRERLAGTPSPASLVASVAAWTWGS